MIESIWYFLLFVAVFQPQKPQIKLLHSCVDQTFKRLVSREHDTDGTSQERKESKPDELHAHTKQQFCCRVAIDISISNSCNCGQNEIKGVGINFNNKIKVFKEFIILRASLLLDEGSDPAICPIASFLAIILHSLTPDVDPDACHQMCEEDNCNLQSDKVNILTYLLSCVSKPAHENLFSDDINLVKESVPMNESQQFELVVVVAFFESYQTWKSSKAVKNKRGFQVIDPIYSEVGFFLGRRKFIEGQDNVKREAGINENLHSSE